MKSLSWLTEHVLADASMRCDADHSRDLIEITKRIEHEGESFLTISLPAFNQGFERALAEGKLLKAHTPSFRWHRRGLPEFLRGFLSQVFDFEGNLLPNASVEAISCIRQVCLLHKKVLRECTEVRKRRSINAYRQCENDVRSWSQEPPREALSAFAKTAAVVWSEIMRGVPFGDPRHALRPSHGPGTTRERILGNSKWNFRKWHRRMETYFPYDDFGIASIRNMDGNGLFQGVDFVEPADEQPVRVVFVPKTQKTPRVIAIEPVCVQFMQQAMMNFLVPLIEKGSLTGGRVNFSDQSINGVIAKLSSRDGTLATLDLSEASDRVSSLHVWTMLESVPLLRDMIFACRSTHAELPDGDIVELSKFASMGSACCFPMEAMVFFITIVSRRLVELKLPINERNVAKCCKSLYVYGDDIIVPADEASTVCGHLQLMGLKVNSHKSFWTGKFRESCGMDAYDGERVTPIYSRYERPSNRQDGSALTSWVSMANQFYMAGFWKTAKAVRAHVESILGPLPFLSSRGSGLFWTNYSNVVQMSRWVQDTMSYKVKTWVPRLTYRNDPLDGDAALLKCFLLVGSKEPVDPKHLARSVVRGKLALSYRWVPST